MATDTGVELDFGSERQILQERPGGHQVRLDSPLQRQPQGWPYIVVECSHLSRTQKMGSIRRQNFPNAFSYYEIADSRFWQTPWDTFDIRRGVCSDGCQCAELQKVSF